MVNAAEPQSSRHAANDVVACNFGIPPCPPLDQEERWMAIDLCPKWEKIVRATHFVMATCHAIHMHICPGMVLRPSGKFFQVNFVPPLLPPSSIWPNCCSPFMPHNILHCTYMAQNRPPATIMTQTRTRPARAFCKDFGACIQESIRSVAGFGITYFKYLKDCSRLPFRTCTWMDAEIAAAGTQL